MGRYPEGIDDLLEDVTEKLHTAGYLTKTVPDVMPYKWGKLMGNIGNAIGAITNGDWNSTTSIFRAAIDEATDIANRAGIKWISQEQVAKDWPEITAPLLGSLNTEAQSSTWQSLVRRQGSVETEYLNGEIVRVATRLGMQAPINEKLMKITQDMAANDETPGKYTVAELCSMLGLSQD